MENHKDRTESEALEDEENKKMKFSQAAELVLFDVKDSNILGLAPKEIVQLAIEKKYITTTGKTPHASMSAAITECIKNLGDASPFERVGPATYKYREIEKRVQSENPQPQIVPKKRKYKKRKKKSKKEEEEEEDENEDFEEDEFYEDEESEEDNPPTPPYKKKLRQKEEEMKGKQVNDPIPIEVPLNIDLNVSTQRITRRAVKEQITLIDLVHQETKGNSPNTKLIQKIKTEAQNLLSPKNKDQKEEAPVVKETPKKTSPKPKKEIFEKKPIVSPDAKIPIPSTQKVVPKKELEKKELPRLGVKVEVQNIAPKALAPKMEEFVKAPEPKVEVKQEIVSASPPKIVAPIEPIKIESETRPIKIDPIPVQPLQIPLQSNGVIQSNIDFGFDKLKQVPVFYPTMEEFSDLSSYLIKIHEECLEFGLARIVPPKEWKPFGSEENHATWINYNKEYKFGERDMTHPKYQKVELSKPGIAQLRPDLRMKISTVESFKTSVERLESSNLSDKEQDSLFWNSLSNGPVSIASDQADSFFDSSKWNISKLNSLLKYIRCPLPGVTSFSTFYGNWKSCMPWHKEDMNLYRISYLHFGKPKEWFSISSQKSQEFENVVAEMFPEEVKVCPHFIRHKTTLVAPNYLLEHDLSVNVGVQMPGEFVVVFPGVYHQSFDYGFNCSEGTNFALKPWLDVADQGHSKCACKSRLLWDFDMDNFRKAIHGEQEYGDIVKFLDEMDLE